MRIVTLLLGVWYLYAPHHGWATEVQPYDPALLARFLYSASGSASPLPEDLQLLGQASAAYRAGDYEQEELALAQLILSEPGALKQLAQTETLARLLTTAIQKKKELIATLKAAAARDLIQKVSTLSATQRSPQSPNEQSALSLADALLGLSDHLVSNGSDGVNAAEYIATHRILTLPLSYALESLEYRSPIFVRWVALIEWMISNFMGSSRFLPDDDARLYYSHTVADLLSDDGAILSTRTVTAILANSTYDVLKTAAVVAVLGGEVLTLIPSGGASAPALIASLPLLNGLLIGDLVVNKTVTIAKEGWKSQLGIDQVASTLLLVALAPAGKVVGQWGNGLRIAQTVAGTGAMGIITAGSLYQITHARKVAAATAQTEWRVYQNAVINLAFAAIAGIRAHKNLTSVRELKIQLAKNSSALEAQAKETPSPPTANEEAFASIIHEAWRAERYNSVTRTFEPRPKVINGKEYDIPNLPFKDLPEFYRTENLASARVAVRLFDEQIAAGKPLDPEFFDRAGDALHQSWMERNAHWAPPEQMLPFKDLTPVEQAKDLLILQKFARLIETSR